ncbi:MAG: peroxiredoxin-like family protein [Woeseiaceae bacterium]
MARLRNRLRIFLGFCVAVIPGLAGPALAEDELSLPTMVPELGVTPSDKLGTNDQGIGLAPGDKVAGFTVHSFDGKSVSWEELRKKGRLLVIFYRGGWCPYCNLQIRQLTLAYPKFEERGILPVLISVDEADASSLVRNTYEIPFPVLSDPDLHALEAFRVTMEVDEATRERYKEYGIDLSAWSGRDHHKIAVPSAFFVDKNGTVLWAHSAMDYRVRPSPQQLLEVADRLDW